MTQHGAPQHTTTPKQGTPTEGLTKTSHGTPPEGAAPARHTPARGHRASGNNGGGPPTQTAAKKVNTGTAEAKGHGKPQPP